MPSPKLTAIITALMFIAGSQGANAAYDLVQLQKIERYIATSNCGGLLGYLRQNPGIMVGSDPLARELRSFASGVEGGIIQCLSARSGGNGPSERLAVQPDVTSGDQNLGVAY